MKKLFSLLFFLCVSVISYAQIIEAVHWRFSVKDISGSEKELVFTANMDDGWHLYGMNIPDGGPAATTFSFDEIHGAVLDGGVTSSSRLIKKYDKQFEMELSWYEKQAVFIQKIKLTAPTFSITGNVRAMACNDQSCLPPTTEEFTFTGKGTPAEATKPESLQKENIKLINLKCHDLKHQINEYALKGKINQEFVKEIQETISIYDANINTGNEVLDIILTEKSLLCNEKGIVLTCMVSQCDLSFIKEGELYSFFGNILDNAINAVSLINNKEKRCIGVNVHQIEKFIAIKVDNYFSGEIDLSSDGLPITKKDTNYHGFGMQSIKMIVDKYNGTLNIEIDEDVFILNVIFPTK